MRPQRVCSPEEIDRCNQLPAVNLYSGFHGEEYSFAPALLKYKRPESIFSATLNGLGRGTFFESIHDRGLAQIFESFQHLRQPRPLGQIRKFGPLVTVGSNLVDATFSMEGSGKQVNGGV